MLSLRIIAGGMLLLSVELSQPPIGAEPPPKPVFFYASLSGRPTFDEDVQGGNPFATALVQLLSRRSASFSAFQADLIALTRDASRGAQQPEVIGGDSLAAWSFLPKPRKESWRALVVVFSDYAGSSIGPSLPGAKRDYHRIAEALSRAGFVVTSLIDPGRESLANGLKDFEARTADSDVALIYTTGHGVETDGVSRVLLPYARADRSNALPVTELAKAARARRANLVFYAACRNKPNLPIRTNGDRRRPTSR